MKRPGWYIVAYDIADPKRLQQVYRILKKEGMAVQQSVFFVYGDQPAVDRILDRLSSVIKSDRDDIRAYPVTHPGEVWTTGGPIAQFPLVQPGGNAGVRGGKDGTEKEKGGKGRSWWKKLFGG
jgi:CRISPR-associated protein Cas2